MPESAKRFNADSQLLAEAIEEIESKIINVFMACTFLFEQVQANNKILNNS